MLLLLVNSITTSIIEHIFVHGAGEARNQRKELEVVEMKFAIDTPDTIKAELPDISINNVCQEALPITVCQEVAAAATWALPCPSALKPVWPDLCQDVFGLR